MPSLLPRLRCRSIWPTQKPATAPSSEPLAAEKSPINAAMPPTTEPITAKAQFIALLPLSIFIVLRSRVVPDRGCFGTAGRRTGLRASSAGRRATRARGLAGLRGMYHSCRRRFSRLARRRDRRAIGAPRRFLVAFADGHAFYWRVGLIGREIVAKRRACARACRKRAPREASAAAHKTAMQCPSLLAVRVLHRRNRGPPQAPARPAGLRGVSYLRKRLS
ncbi:membrane -like domain protein [Burkholderia cenocepacia]|uniref:Membrane-like domain protein n=1 Tax=Burkholderia cenocepacia TaxID=95486 RepID=A0AAN0RXG2_9BURK|nr:membrane -like domain protein [Burkholderia cenocepacia]